MNKVRVLQAIPLAVMSKNGVRGVNGTETLPLYALPYFLNQDLELFIMYSSEGRLFDSYKTLCQNIIDYKFDNKYNFLSIIFLVKTIRKNKIEVIHSQGPPSFDLMIAIAARICGIKHIITRPAQIMNAVRSNFKNFLYQFVDIFTLNLASSVVAVSAEGKTFLDSIMFKPCTLIHNGIDLKRYKNTMKKNSILNFSRNSKFVVGMTAQLTPIKGWFDFIDIIAALKNNYINIEGWVVGDGPLREELELYVQKNNLIDNIKFLGYQHDIISVLENIDVFLFTSYSEGLSISILEALASGLPCVITNVGGAIEQVDFNFNGFHFQPGDINSAVFFVSKLLDDHKLRCFFSANSISLCEEKFSLENMVLEYTNMYLS